MSTHAPATPPPGSSEHVAPEHVVDSAPPSVLVGDDGTRHSRRAVDHATDAALRAGLPLAVLRVLGESVDPDRSFAAQRRDLAMALEEARNQLEATISRVRARRPGIQVDGDVLVAPGAPDLARHLGSCALVVVGARSGRGLRAFTLDSTSRTLLRAARCPLVVVPDEGSEPGPSRTSWPTVVVGLDDGPLGPAVLRVAAEQAQRRAATLKVVHAYRGGAGAVHADARAQAEAFCARQIAIAVTDPSLPVSLIVTPDPPGLALVRWARDADLLVVGSRGPLALARLTLESVSRAVLDVMPCPIQLILATESDAAIAVETEPARV